AYRERCGVAAPVLFDRGIPDVAGYLRLEGPPVGGHVLQAAQRLRYNAKVFLCPPWPQIYRQDTEPRQTAAVAERTCAVLACTCRQLGYDLIEVPKRPVAD